MLRIYNKYFVCSDKRTVLARNNIAAMFAIKLVSVLVNLAMVPLVINYINIERYGVWLTLTSLISWFSFFDIGLTNGLRNKFAEAKAKNDHVLARCYISTTYALLMVIFFVIWIVFGLINMILNWSEILNVSKVLNDELRIIVLIVVTLFCIQFVLKTVHTIMVADQKPAYASFFDMLAQLLSLIALNVLLKSYKSSLIYMSIVISVSPIIILFISSVYFFNNQLKLYSPSIKYVDMSLVKDLGSISIKFFVLQLSTFVLYQVNNIIIAHVGTSSDVAIYNIVFKYMGVVLIIATVIYSPFWSAFTEAYVVKDMMWMKRIYKKMFKVNLYLIIVVLFMVLISDNVYKLWVGGDVKISLIYTFVVGLYVWIMSLLFFMSQILNGMGKIYLQLLLSFLSLTHLYVGYFLGCIYGVQGVVMSSIIISSIMAYYATIQVDKIINNSASGIWIK